MVIIIVVTLLLTLCRHVSLGKLSLDRWMAWNCFLSIINPEIFLIHIQDSEETQAAAVCAIISDIVS